MTPDIARAIEAEVTKLRGELGDVLMPTATMARVFRSLDEITYLCHEVLAVAE